MPATRIDALKGFLNRDPNDTFSRYALALEYAKVARVPDALHEFQVLLETDPTYVAGYYHMGKTLETARRFDEARDAYQKGIAAAAGKNDRHAVSELQQALDELDQITSP